MALDFCLNLNSKMTTVQGCFQFGVSCACADRCRGVLFAIKLHLSFCVVVVYQQNRVILALYRMRAPFAFSRPLKGNLTVLTKSVQETVGRALTRRRNIKGVVELKTSQMNVAPKYKNDHLGVGLEVTRPLSVLTANETNYILCC